MKYVLLIYEDPNVWNAMPAAERDSIMAEYGTFTREIIASGHFAGGEQLHEPSRATSVRLREGKRLVHDGPFAETREHLGGYYVIEAKDLDDALSIAERIPSARIGTIEVRPVVPTP
ncbi:MAG: YciI family protein [Acidobacteriota bacterium]|nr:YciI family protein [Acidobacteriota bacterium]